jgi:hypothetical protein
MSGRTTMAAQGREMWRAATIALVCLLAGSVTEASAATVTFEGVVASIFVHPAPYTEAGFTLTDLNSPIGDAILGATSAGTSSNGTSIFGFCSVCAPGSSSAVIELTAVGGGAFSLNSLDAADLETNTSSTQSIVAAGNLMGGGTVTQTLSLTGIWTTFLAFGFTKSRQR